MTLTQVSVPAIAEGAVIDHIPSGKALLIARLLQMLGHDEVLTLAMNLPSPSIGKKDIIKIASRELTSIEIEQIASLAPKATINIIRDYAVTQKLRPKPPAHLRGVLICRNGRCVTRQENVDSCFVIVQTPSRPLFRCHYCGFQSGEALIDL